MFCRSWSVDVEIWAQSLRVEKRQTDGSPPPSRGRSRRYRISKEHNKENFTLTPRSVPFGIAIFRLIRIFILAKGTFVETGVVSRRPIHPPNGLASPFHFHQRYSTPSSPKTKIFGCLFRGPAPPTACRGTLTPGRIQRRHGTAPFVHAPSRWEILIDFDIPNHYI